MTEGTFKDDNIDKLNELYPPIFVEEAPKPCFSYDVNGPRLMIEKIENINFKSYAGNKILGPFHKNFTCIIGPNGSGKSNVIDSLLFVFGFKASKIRSKKLSVLIHKSEYFPNIDSCSVKVFFQTIVPRDDDDENGFDVVDGSQFVVSRTAFRDNNSVININNKKVSNKDAAEFLKGKGIDLDHNRFLILQGEVEQIALMKPKATTEFDDGLLEYLEDIIGSNRFKKPLDILFQRLDELCELRTEKLNRVKAVEKEKKELEGVRNDAVKYLKLWNEIIIRQNINFQIKRQGYVELETVANGRLEGILKELDDTTNEINQINATKSEKQKVVNELTKDVMMKRQEYDTCRDDFKKLEVEDASLRDSRKHCKCLVDKLEANLKEQEAKLDMYKNVPKESENRITNLTKEINNLEGLSKKEEELLNQEQTKLGEETKPLQNKRDKLNEEVILEEKKLNKQEGEISELKCELDLLLKNHQKEEEKNTKIKENLDSVKLKLKDSEEVIKEFSKKLPSMKLEFQKTTNELEANKKASSSLRQEIYCMQQKLRESTSNSRDSGTIKFLLEQQKMGKVSGVIGRLGDLGTIDPKYDIAISTACGRLDSIVCETIDSAQTCVELMKKYNISRSAFIALDKISKFEQLSTKPFTSPNNSRRLFDLVNCAPKYKAVFYFALRDILTVNNIDEARQINRGRKELFRIVTLQGELIEVSGAMTGGGNQITRGKIRLESNRNDHENSVKNSVIDVAEVEFECKENEKKLSSLATLIDQLETKYDDLKRQIYDDERKYNYHKNGLEALKTEEGVLISKFEDSSNRLSELKPSPIKVTGLEKSISTLNKKFEKDSSNLKLLRKKVNDLTSEIEKIGMARLGCIESRINSVEEKLKEKQKTLKKIIQSVKTAEKIVEETTAALEKDSETLELKQKELKTTDETISALDIKAKETLAHYNQANREFNDLKNLKEAKEKEMASEIEKIKQLQQMQIQINRNIKEEEDVVRKYVIQIKQVDVSIQKLKLYPIPEDCRNNEDTSFLELIGASEDQILFSSQKESYAGNGFTKLKMYSDDELNRLKMQNINFQDLEEELQRQKPNLAAIEEYRMKEEIYMTRAAELSTVTEIRDSQKQEIERLKKQRLSEFSAGFDLITGKLKEMYQMITMGGDAELELVDSLDPFSDGIVFSVRPPKKSWKNISNLSGGEKTLSSLALVFALHHFKPTPFYVMDEIDAALDFKNVSIVANYIQQRTKNAQFIIISLRNNMYELGDRLVGIYKPFNFSKTVVIDPKKFEQYLVKTNAMKAAKSGKPDDNIGTNTINLPMTPSQRSEIMELSQTSTNSNDMIIDN